MDQDPAELSRERAVSSEPCSTRPNPFDEAESSSSRKRQRVSRQDSRSRSVDTARNSAPVSDSRSLRESSTKPDSEPTLPQTPTRTPIDRPPPERTSSKVTINLRTPRLLESPTPSPPPSSSPSKMANDEEDTGMRRSVESESDALSTIPAIETPSSSPSDAGSPTIELVPPSEDDRGSQSPPVAILSGDAEYADLWSDFPLLGGDGNLLSAVKSVQNYMQYGMLQQMPDLFYHCSLC